MYLFALKHGIIPAGNAGCTKVTGCGNKAALAAFAENWCRANKTDAVFCMSDYTQKMCEMSPQKLSAYVRTVGTLIYIR